MTDFTTSKELPEEVRKYFTCLILGTYTLEIGEDGKSKWKCEYYDKIPESNEPSKIDSN